MEVQIKTSLFYLFGEQKGELKESLTELFELEKVGFKNIADTLVYASSNQLEVNVDFTNVDSMPSKHQKTFLAYFSTQEHKLVNDYINSFIPKGFDSAKKKKCRTEVIINIVEIIYEQLID